VNDEASTICVAAGRRDGVSDAAVDRLLVYARALEQLEASGRDVVTSSELAQLLGPTPDLIRRDLSYLRAGAFGRGYDVRRLRRSLGRTLGLDREWRLALVGVGRLGQALLCDGGFIPAGFRIAKAFDLDPHVVGREIGDVTVEDVARIDDSLRGESIQIGIVAVPADAAQQAVDALAANDVQAILNYGNVAALVPSGIEVRQVDPVVALQALAYRLSLHRHGMRRRRIG
jgi:redox-sensing transcriptional repressor